MESSNNYFELIEWFKKNIDWLNTILIGGEHDSAMIDGVEKPSIDKRFAERFLAFQALVQGRQAFETRNALLLSGAPPAETPLAEVWNDSTPDYNGLYGYISGTGWTKSPYDKMTEFSRRVATGRWQLSSPHPDAPDADIYKLNFSSVGKESNMVITVSWETMRVLDGMRNLVVKVADQAPIEIPHGYCLYIDTRQEYVDDASGDGAQGYKVTFAEIAGIGDTFVSGDNLLLIGNYYGIMMGLLAQDFNLAKMNKLLGSDDSKGAVIPRLGLAETVIADVSRSVIVGRWQISSPHPDNPDPSVYKLNFDSVGSGSNMVLTVSWETMRVLDGVKKLVRKVHDQPPLEVPHGYCLFINTRQEYIDDGSSDGNQGYKVTLAEIAGIGDTFVSGDNLLLIGNYYGIMIGLLATDFNLSKTGQLLGRNDQKGPVIPRLGQAEESISKVQSQVEEFSEVRDQVNQLDNPTLAFDVPGFNDMAAVEVDEHDNLLSFYDRFGFLNFESPHLGVRAFASNKNTPAMQVLDESGHVIQEIDQHGGVSSPGSRLWPMPYASENALRSVGDDGDQVVAEINKNKVLNCSPFNHNSVRAVVSEPSLYDTTQVSGAPGLGALVPDDSRILHICVVYGQSLSVGAQGVPLVSTRNPWPEDCWMFSGTPEMDIRLGLATLGGELSAFDPQTATGFQALVAKDGQGNGNRGETVGEALAFELSRVANRVPTPWKSLWIAPGLGGSSYEKLKKGTQPYMNFMSAVTRAKELAESLGMKAVVDFVYLVHGEADAGNAQYYDDLIQWQRDIDLDIKAITNQVRTVPFFMNQPSSFSSAKEAVNGILKAHETSEHHFLVSANYAYPYSPDFVHLAGPGYHLVSETAVPAFLQQNWPGKGWDCLRMLSAIRTGTTVTVSWSVPVPPISLDTVQVTERDAKGFRFRNGSELIGIESVTVTAADTIVIELQSLPSGGSERLEYAMNGHSGQRFEYTMPRGNVRDSAGDKRTSRFDGRRLDNWAVHQEIEVVEA
ncbi:hypothetical protein RQV66_001248 [Vibrio alginolyticus]|nr:hypothetical protein [Vibrio alginolyticus]